MPCCGARGGGETSLLSGHLALGPPPGGDGRRRRRAPRERGTWPCHSSPCSPALDERLVRRRCWNRICHKGSERLPGSGRAGIGLVWFPGGGAPRPALPVGRLQRPPLSSGGTRARGGEGQGAGVSQPQFPKPQAQGPCSWDGCPCPSGLTLSHAPKRPPGEMPPGPSAVAPGRACPVGSSPCQTRCRGAAWPGSLSV